MADLDFGNNEKPDELIQHAWDAGLDRKAVIREGSDAARLLLAGERNEIVTLFWPVPRPLEAVDLWSQNPRSAVPEKLRPFASAVVPGCVVGACITHFFVASHLSEDVGLSALMWIIIGSIVALGVIFQTLIAITLRRRVARLDEQSAFSIVRERLQRGMVVSPAVVPIAVKLLRRGLSPQRS